MLSQRQDRGNQPSAEEVTPEPVKKEKKVDEVLPIEASVVTIEPTEPQPGPPREAPQKALQSKRLSGNDRSDGATPGEVVRPNQPEAERPQTKPDRSLSDRGYTLPLMKGRMKIQLLLWEAELSFQVLQRAYCDVLMNTPGLELLYLGFNGRGTNGLVEIKERTRAAIEVILPDSEVEIYQNYQHSSYFRENPKQILVYIKPINKAQNWCNGIPVPIEQLVPVRLSLEISRTDLNTENVESTSKAKMIDDKKGLSSNNDY